MSNCLKERPGSAPGSIGRTGLNLTDCLMSGLAIFGLKYASLLQFERDARQKESIGSNLRSLYGGARRRRTRRCGSGWTRWTRGRCEGRSSVCWRRCSGARPGGFHLPGRTLPAERGRHGVFQGALRHCCRTRDGRITYYHQLLGAVLVQATGGVPPGAGADLKPTGRGRTTASATRRSACSRT